MMRKTIFLGILAIGAALSFAFFANSDSESLAIGKKAPKADLKMMGINDAEVSLKDLKKDNGLLVIFSCNTCPFVVGSSRGTEGWEGRYAGIKQECDKRDIGMVLINSNEAKRDKGDSMADMKAHASEQGYEHIPYVLDQNHVLADAFGAKTTPHVYLFDSSMSLVYKGAVDDNVENSEEVKEFWLKNAIDNCYQGKKIDPNETRAVGCSIKRVK